MTTNNIASIKSRLTNIAQKEKQTYQLILIRYFTERLIYRLSVSDFKNHFCLKGGALLYAFEQETSRPTMDLDLLGLQIANEQAKLKTVFQTKDVLTDAISNTFQQRATSFVKNPVVFTPDFAENAKRHLQWNAFLRKMNKHVTFEEVDFQSVMSVIIERLQPIYNKLSA